MPAPDGPVDRPGKGGSNIQLLYGNGITWRLAAGYEREAEAVLRQEPDNQLANYAMAAIAEFRGDMARAEAHLGRTGLCIGMDYDDYSLALHRGIAQRYLDGAAAHRDLAPRFVLSLPKSGSTFVAECFARLAGLPRVRVSKGSFSSGRLIPGWLDTFCRLGGVLHDHFPPDPDNRRRLRERPPPALVLLVRDPVIATLSLVDFVLVEGMDKFFAREVGEADLAYLRGLDGRAQRSALFQKLFPRIAGWIDGWLAAGASGELQDCRIAVVRFEDLLADDVGVLSAMERHFDGRVHRFDPADPATRLAVDEVQAGLRRTQGRLMTPHRGRRTADLDDTEQEMVWRALHAQPHLARLYDLAGYLR